MGRYSRSGGVSGGGGGGGGLSSPFADAVADRFTLAEWTEGAITYKFEILLTNGSAHLMLRENDVVVQDFSMNGADSGNPGVGLGYNKFLDVTEAGVFLYGDDLRYDASKGPVVKSPNGSSWRITVDNAGVPGSASA